MLNFKQFLLEMPMGRFQYDFNPPSATIRPSFNDKDMATIKHPKTSMTLEKILERNTRHTFNILFVTHNLESNYKDTIKNFCKQNSIPTQDRITFAKNSSTGGLLTPWMILHTFSHALCEQNKNLFNNLTSLFRPTGGLLFDSSKLFRFKSARTTVKNYGKVITPSQSNRQINEWDELIYEIITEYLWHGYIRHDPSIYKKVTKAEVFILNALHDAVGKIILDYE